jgi:DNA polymerase-3 subunit delta'
MDTHHIQTLGPAQLWIGQHQHVVARIEHFLQTFFCKNNGCNTCIICLHIREKQHHAIMWLHPEKNYTVDQFEDVFNTLSYQLQPDEHFFFIIQKADFLTPTCANKLLKPMEEPPRGYHFILLAERPEQILPTIKSRCVTHMLTTTTLYSTHPLFECFTTKIPSGDAFTKIVDTANINERESIELLDTVIHYWFNTYQKTPSQINLFELITKLQQAQLQPPMPGSCTIFWRNLYLQVQTFLNTP